MSAQATGSIGLVLHQSSALMAAVDALLAAESLEGVIAAAAALGAGPTLAEGFASLASGLAQVETRLRPLASGLVAADAAAAMLAVLPGVVSGLGGLARDTGALVEDLLPSLAAAMPSRQAQQAIGEVSQQVAAVTDSVEDMMAEIAPAEFARLLGGLAALATTLAALKARASGAERAATPALS